MAVVESFNLNGVSINTTVVYDGVYGEDEQPVVDEHISRFMSPAYDTTKVFGFGAEWHVPPYSSSSKCAAVHLCDGVSCLIITLSGCEKLPQSLVSFLNLPNYTFVGFGIKDNVAKLEAMYSCGIINAFELGPLAATAMKKPRLAYIGVDELLSVVTGISLRNQRPLKIFYDWGNAEHYTELLKTATINVYSYQKIGRKLLANDWKL
jgi:hypothetical protein